MLKNILAADDPRTLHEQEAIRSVHQARNAVAGHVARDALGVLAAPTPGDTLEPPVRVSAENLGRERLAVLAANLLIIAAGAAVSVVPRIALGYHVFLAFFAGHAIWMGYALVRRDRGLAVLNAGLIALDCYAIAIRVL